MRNLIRITILAILSIGLSNNAYAADELSIVQVEDAYTSALSVDTSKPFSVKFFATLFSERQLSALSRDVDLASGAIGIGCGRSGAFDAKVEITPIGGNRYKYMCEITDTPLSNSLPSGFSEISIDITQMRNAAIIPRSLFTFARTSTDSFGTKSTQNYPYATATGGWSNGNFYPKIVWTFGLAVNPPATYVFPKFPVKDNLFILFGTNPNAPKATYSLDSKKKTLKVKCPSSTPNFSLGSAKYKTTTRLVIGNNIVGGPNWNYKFPGVPGNTLDVSCISETRLTSNSNQLVGYAESTPVKVKFPK